MLEILCKFSRTVPVTQMEPEFKSRLIELSNRKVIPSDHLLAFIDDCVYTSACSDFCIKFLDIIWRQLLISEELTVDQAMTRRDWSLRLYAAVE